MKLNLAHNWIAKILSLLLAIAIWFLIKNNLAGGDGLFEKTPPRALIVPEQRSGR
jgi:YbbR domain-containing protein